MASLIDVMKMTQEAYPNSLKSGFDTQKEMIGLQQLNQAIAERQQMKDLFSRGGGLPNVSEMGAINPEEAMKMQELNRQALLDQINALEKQSSIQKNQHQLSQEEMKISAGVLGANADQYDADIAAGMPEPQALQKFHTLNGQAIEQLNRAGIGANVQGSYDPNAITPDVAHRAAQAHGIITNRVANQREQLSANIPQRPSGASVFTSPEGIQMRVPAANELPQAGTVQTTPMAGNDFQQALEPIVANEVNNAGLNPAIVPFIVSHSALETGNGQAVHDNNLFNMTGKGVVRGDHNAAGQPIKQSFKAYQTPQQAISDYIGWIKRNAPDALNATTAQEFGDALKRGNYAEAPDFTDNLSARSDLLYGSNAGQNDGQKFPIPPPAPTGNPILDARNKVGYEKARVDFLAKQAEESRLPALEAEKQTAKDVATEKQLLAHSLRIGDEILSNQDDIRQMIKESTSGKLENKMSTLYGDIVGYSTPGENKIAGLQVIGANLLDLASKMPGQQSDKELLVQQAKVAANIGNADIPYEQRLNAFNEFIKKYNSMKELSLKMNAKENARKPITFSDGTKGFAVFKGGEWQPE